MDNLGADTEKLFYEPFKISESTAKSLPAPNSGP